MTQVDSGSDSAETLKLGKLVGKGQDDELSQYVGRLDIYDLIACQSSDERDSTETETFVEGEEDGDGEDDEVDVDDAGTGVGTVLATMPVPLRAPLAPAPPLVRLKSSLKLSSSGSSTSHSGTAKNVRFAQQLTKVKRFNSSLEPISISCDNSPRITPLVALDSWTSDEDDEFWFGTALSRTKLPLSSSALRSGVTGQPGRHRDCDSDCDSDTDCCTEYDSDNDAPLTFGRSPVDTRSRFSVERWDFISTNIAPLVARRALDLETLILAYLQGNNIKLSSVSPCLDSSKLQGLIYVANLNFEKFIEVKYTFNNWRDIHYVTAQYHRTVTSCIDEFRFTVNLAGLKFFMQMKNLLYCGSGPETICPLTMELCCRYDVNGETYYDNNNYDNYQLRLNAVTSPVSRRRRRRSNDVPSTKLPLRRYLSADAISTSTALSTKQEAGPTSTAQSAGRRFSEDTDYYNTSPLKHLFHNEPTLAKTPKVTTPKQEPATPVNAVLPMHFLFGQDTAPNYTHKSPSPKPISSATNGWASEADSGSPAPNRGGSLPSSICSSESSFSFTTEAPRVMKAFSTNDLRSAHSKDMKRDLSFDGANTVTPHAKSVKLSRKKSMDYDKLLQSYCFYDPAKDITTTSQSSPCLTNYHQQVSTPTITPEQ